MFYVLAKQKKEKTKLIILLVSKFADIPKILIVQKRYHGAFVLYITSNGN